MDAEGWERVDLYGPTITVWRHAATGRFRVRTSAGATLEVGAESRETLESLLLALVDAKRALTGEEFVAGKTAQARSAHSTSEGEALVKFEPEDLEYLRARVRVGKEASLDAAVARAVKAYMRDLLKRESTDDDEGGAEARLPRRPRPSQSTLDPAAAVTGTGVGPIQRDLLRRAAEKGAITRLDVGRAYGITASRRNASNARVKAEGAVNALVARGLLRFEVRDGEATWVLTETGRALVEEWASMG